MCDYSLMGVPNRLANEQEDLIAHRFPTGSMGLAAPADVKCSTKSAARPRSFWVALKEFFNPPEHTQVAAVCIPPGARLWLRDIPERLQTSLGVGREEECTFTQTSQAVNTYRDAVRFSNGKTVRLQELREGQRVRVLDLSLAEPAAPPLEETFVYRL
ncbi:MAG TPA: hypothetical protein VMI94_01990 [Bryobacteraceae bacterium]|nr:hypothetical protein [Bryobacteraceae bacterium]